MIDEYEKLLEINMEREFRKHCKNELMKEEVKKEEVKKEEVKKVKKE